MYRKFALSLVLLFIFSCSKKIESQSKNQVENIEERKPGKVYFDFDEVEHFFIDISEDESSELALNENPSKKEKALSEILEDYKMDYTDDLESYGFTKTLLDKSKFESIKEIFSENKCETGYAAACIPVYRDIFLFKRNGKTIGKAKVCFGCRLYSIEGTKLDIENFGQCGDFEKLEKLLK